MKIEIKSIKDKILFSHECENNTLKKTIEAANLMGANLRGADLAGADLRGADLRGANLRGADLAGAYLMGAYLMGANLARAKNIPYIPLACPSDGAFTAWKKVNNFLVELQIPADAKRSSATTLKCRCDKAFVIKIINMGTNEEISEIINTAHFPYITYTIGKMVYPNNFNEDRFNECSSGIHFFINKQDAINY